MNTKADLLAPVQGYASLGPVRIHYAEMGQGPLVVLLHGFPEAWFSYRHQLPALAGAGFHAVAPDMRGYNLSDKPHGIGSYSVDRLATDVARLIRFFRQDRAIVVGHDWGAGVAWAFAMRYPEMLDRLVIMNVPHPLRMMNALRTMPRQIVKSWYIFFFQLPYLPEMTFRFGDYAFLRWTLKHDPVRRGTFREEDIERYVQAMKQPGAVAAGINHYRALLQRGPRFMKQWLRPIEAPVLVIWGEQDRYLEASLAVPDPRWVPNCRVEYLPNASHWVQNDRPEQVNYLLLDFLAA